MLFMDSGMNKYVTVAIFFFLLCLTYKYYRNVYVFNDNNKSQKIPSATEHNGYLLKTNEKQGESKLKHFPHTTFRLASYYTDHMVLQKEPYSATIWGFWDGTGEVSVELQNTSYSYITLFKEYSSRDARIWRVQLPPQPPGGPYTVYIKYTPPDRHSLTLKLEDILFGDIWFCSGQSNMKYSLERMNTVMPLKTDTQTYSQVRYYQTKYQRSNAPNDDLKIKSDNWTHIQKGTEAGSDFSALCWLYGKQLYNDLQYPIGLVHSSHQGTSIEEWSDFSTLKSCHADNMKDRKEGQYADRLALLSDADRSSLWNAMIYPFLRMVIRGVIWYQGENNTEFHRDKYNCTFPAMINSWRNEWSRATGGATEQQFPFGFVQLAGYGREEDEFWTWIRWHQTADYGFAPNPAMVNTFMAVTADLPHQKDPVNDIHPNDKSTVAQRLSWSALHHVYGKSFYPKSGPTVIESSIKYEEDGYIFFAYDQPITIRQTTGFKFCCSLPTENCSMNSNAKEWMEAMGVYQHNSSSLRIKVSCKLTVLLYIWSALPCLYKNCPVYSNDSYQLPAAPWRWELST